MNTDYPRMLFHRRKDPVTVQTREEEDALGGEWSRRIWPPEPQTPEPAEEPEPESDPEPEPEPEEEEEVLPRVPHHAVKPPIKRPAAAKTTRRKR